MLVIPYIFLMITIDQSAITVTPRPAVSLEQCQQLVDLQRDRGLPNVIAYCVPHGASLQLETDTGPAS